METHREMPPDVELDVYLREELELSEEDVKSRAGEFFADIKKKHEKSGVDRFLIITNLPCGDSAKLRDNLVTRLKADCLNIDCQMIPGGIGKMLQSFDDEIARALKETSGA